MEKNFLNETDYFVVFFSYINFQIVCVGNHSNSMEKDLLINPSIWLVYPAVVINCVLNILIHMKRRTIEKQDQNNQSNLNPKLKIYNNKVPRNLGSFLTKCLYVIMMTFGSLVMGILNS